MPRIAELFEHNGTLCARLEGFSLEEDGSVSLYTEKEVERLKRDVALAIIDQIDQLYPKPSR